MSAKKRSTSKTPTKRSVEKLQQKKITYKEKLIAQLQPYQDSKTTQMEIQQPELGSSLLEAIIEPEISNENIINLLSSCRSEQLIDETASNFLPQKIPILFEKLVQIIRNGLDRDRQLIFLKWIDRITQIHIDKLSKKDDISEYLKNYEEFPIEVEKLRGKLSMIC